MCPSMSRRPRSLAGRNAAHRQLLQSGPQRCPPEGVLLGAAEGVASQREFTNGQGVEPEFLDGPSQDGCRSANVVAHYRAALLMGCEALGERLCGFQRTIPLFPEIGVE